MHRNGNEALDNVNKTTQQHAEKAMDFCCIASQKQQKSVKLMTFVQRGGRLRSIGKMSLIFEFFQLQLVKEILFGFGNDTGNRSRFHREKVIVSSNVTTSGLFKNTPVCN